MAFKDNAREHQTIYFGEKVNQSNIKNRKGRAQAHWLTDIAAASGMNFYNGYNIFAEAKASRGNKKDTPEWFYDTLRSQHIPFNFFIPLEKEVDLNKKVWNELLKIEIERVDKVEIEYPPMDKELLNDKTSFDAFIEYTNTKKEKGILGIEVKYTEGGYSAGKTESDLINKEDSTYYKATKESELYDLEACNLKSVSDNYLRQNKNRQIWRNHLLAYVYAKKNDINNFHSITLYHEGNTHFTKAFEGYQNYLTKDGKASLKSITYSEFCKVLIKHATTDNQKGWLKYLVKRYDVKL